MTQHNETRGALTFRKKPVAIEAFKLGHDGMPDWFMDRLTSNDVTTHNVDDRLYGGPDYALIKTLEGTMRAEYGDYIIRGVQGELYPCKPDIFAQTYESADSKLPAGDGLTDEQLTELWQQINNEAMRPTMNRVPVHIKFARLLAAPRQPEEVGAGMQGGHFKRYAALDEAGKQASEGMRRLEDYLEDTSRRSSDMPQYKAGCQLCQRVHGHAPKCPNAALAQHALGEPFESVLHDNLPKLYVEDASAQQDEPECMRSHPHENMNAACEAKTVEARAANQAAQQDEREADLLVKLDDAKRALHFWKTQYQTLANAQQVQADAGAMSDKATLSLIEAVNQEVQLIRTDPDSSLSNSAQRALTYIARVVAAHPSPAGESDDAALLVWLMKNVNCDEIDGLDHIPFGLTLDDHFGAFREAIRAAMSREQSGEKGGERG